MARHTVSLILAAAALAGPQAARADPAGLYNQRCAMCHQASGLGLPGAFPKIAGRVGAIAGSPDGRRYLLLVMLNGLNGSIVVDGAQISGVMPPVRYLKDQEIADLLNHAASLKPARKAAPFTAAEVAKVRAEPTTGPTKVAAERARLVSAGKIK